MKPPNAPNTPKRRRSFGVFGVFGGLVLLLAAAAATPAIAADDPAALELDGLAREARLDYEGAFDAYGRALEAALDAADHAAAEVYVHKLTFLGERTGRFPALGEAAAKARARRLPPLLDARCALAEGRAALAAGDIARAEKIAAGLGFLGRFAIAGPFENERGGDFGTAYGPEKGPIDLEKRYAGKGREIGWSFPSRDAFLGEVDLDAMLRPNDEALAYALTYVKWEAEPRAAALRAGSDEGLKVWWNEDLVLARDVNRTRELDQDAAAIVLRKGWNRLLLKVTERKGPWGFMVRITEPDGKPLEKPLAVEPRVAVADAAALAPLPPGAPALPEPGRGAIDHYDALVKAGKATARDFFHLGYLHYRRKAHDENEHPDRDAFKQAVALEEKSSIYHAYLSFVSSASGEFSVNREENARRMELVRALELDPVHARAALFLGDYYFRSLRNADKAEQFADQALKAAPRALDAIVLKADLATRRGWGASARALLLGLEKDAATKTNPGALARVASVRAGLGDLAAAERLLRAALEIDFAAGSVRSQLVETLKARGDVAGALAALADRARLEPFDVGTRLERATLLAGGDRLAEAAKEVDGALEISPQDDAALAERGRILLRLGKTAAALDDFGRALALNPNRVEIRRYVEFLRAEEKPFEAEYRLDAEAAIAAAKDVPLDKEVGARVVLENVVMRVNPDGTASRFEQRVLRIENDEGVEGFDHYGVSFAVGEQKVTFKRATVFKTDGRREEARIDNASGDGGAGEFTTYSSRGVDLPTLAIGDSVVVEFRLDDLRQSFFGDYFGHVHFFQGMAPVERSRFTLVAPAEKQLHFNPRRLDQEPEVKKSADGATVVRVWEKRKVPKIEQEPNMPSYEEIAPCIQVSTFKDWDAFAKWYWSLVRKQQEISPEMRAKVTELVNGKKTREEKIRAIYNFVVTDVRYNDRWEFGVHGFKPYNADSIFQRRFGDCKDKATLIITMLSAVDIPAFPVLIEGESARSEEDFTLPLMSHFNHCIAYAPGPAPDGGDGWFLDGTAQFHEATNLPNMDFGAKVLIVRPDGGEIKQVKWPDPLKENGLREEHRVALRADGGATIASEIVPGGIYSVVMRDSFQNPGKRRETLEKIYGRHFAGATVVEESFGVLRNLDEPGRVRFKVDVPKLVKQAGGGFAIEEVPSAFFEFIYAEHVSDFAAKAERRYDVVLPVPSGVEATIEYALPEGFTLKTTPAETKIDSEFGTYVKRYEVSGKSLRVTRRLSVNAQRIPVAKYQAWRKFANEIDRADDDRAVLGKGGPQE